MDGVPPCHRALAAPDRSNQVEVDDMVLALGGQILFGQLCTACHGADMLAVRDHDFHMLRDLRCFHHPFCSVLAMGIHERRLGSGFPCTGSAAVRFPLPPAIARELTDPC